MTPAQTRVLNDFVDELLVHLRIMDDLSTVQFMDRGLEYLDLIIFENGRHSRAQCRKDVVNALSKGVGVNYRSLTKGKGVYLTDLYAVDGLPFVVELSNARRGGKALTFAHISDVPEFESC
jgi:hypothetical protein